MAVLGLAGFCLHLVALVGAVWVLSNLERTFRAAVGTLRWRIKLAMIGMVVLFGCRVYTGSQALLYRSVHSQLELLNVVALLIASAVVTLALLPVELVERLPSVCLNRRLFGFCPGCGTVRALSHLLHGDLTGALKQNINCLVVAPLLLGLAAWYAAVALRPRRLS